MKTFFHQMDNYTPVTKMNNSVHTREGDVQSGTSHEQKSKEDKEAVLNEKVHSEIEDTNPQNLAQNQTFQDTILQEKLNATEKQLLEDFHQEHPQISLPDNYIETTINQNNKTVIADSDKTTEKLDIDNIDLFQIPPENILQLINYNV
jgi:hypothetical protein